MYFLENPIAIMVASSFFLSSADIIMVLKTSVEAIKKKRASIIMIIKS